MVSPALSALLNSFFKSIIKCRKGARTIYNLKCTYSGGHCHNYAHITKVEYRSDTGLISVSGDDILTKDYPLNSDLHLVSTLRSYNVPHICLKSIEATKEKD